MSPINLCLLASDSCWLILTCVGTGVLESFGLTDGRIKDNNFLLNIDNDLEFLMCGSMDLTYTTRW